MFPGIRSMLLVITNQIHSLHILVLFFWLRTIKYVKLLHIDYGKHTFLSFVLSEIKV